MAIKFLCPACSQPIEVDPEWGGRQVACPFCRRAVSAPESSTYAPSEAPPMASPSMGVSPPEWVGVVGVPQSQPRGNALAAWALVLASAAFLLYVALNVLLARQVLELAGPEGSMQEMQRALAEELEQGTVPDWVVAAALGLFAIFALWVGGLVCGVIAVRRPARRGMAITALVLSGVMFLFFCGGTLVGGLG